MAQTTYSEARRQLTTAEAHLASAGGVSRSHVEAIVTLRRVLADYEAQSGDAAVAAFMKADPDSPAYYGLYRLLTAESDMARARGEDPRVACRSWLVNAIEIATNLLHLVDQRDSSSEAGTQ